MSDEVPLRSINASKNIPPADGRQRVYWGSTNQNLLHMSNCIERQNNIFDEYYF